MLVRLSYLFLCTVGVLSQHVTFHNVEVQCQTEDYEVFNVVINSTDQLPHDVTRITVVGNSAVPVIFEGAIADLPSLKVLQLRQNGVKEIRPGGFKNLPVLEAMRLNGNKLNEIKAGVFINLTLVFLNLDHNLIETVSPQAFEGLVKLEVLDLSNNRIKTFHADWLRNKPVLTSVIFTYNEIEALPDGAFERYHNDVDLSNNRIKNVSTQIFGSGDDKRSFGHLWLADNSIEMWSEEFVRGVQIQVLDLSRNRLKCLEGKIEHFFVASQTRIDGNPWNCECLLKMAQWVEKHKKRVSMRASVNHCNYTGEFPRML